MGSWAEDVREKLLDEGPQPLDCGVPPELARQDIRSFSLEGGKGATMNGTGRTRQVLYVEGHHEPKEVIEAYLDENPRVSENLNSQSLHQRVVRRKGDAWREASFSIFGPFNLPPETDTSWSPGGTCPMCGEEYDGPFLRDHLPCD